MERAAKPSGRAVKGWSDEVIRLLAALRSSKTNPCMSLSLISRNGPFNPPSGKISPGLRPFLAKQIFPAGGCFVALRPYR